MESFKLALLRGLAPVIEWIGKVTAPWTVKTVRGDFYYHIREQIEPGDVILSSTDGHLSNVINPSGFNHGAIYVGMEDGVGYVVEALGKGVIKKDLVTHLLQKDHAAILKPKNTSKNDRERLAVLAKKCLGSKYDFLFSSNNKDFYCFELIAFVYNHVFGGGLVKPRGNMMGYLFFNDDSFLGELDVFTKIADSEVFYSKK